MVLGLTQGPVSGCSKAIIGLMSGIVKGPALGQFGGPSLDQVASPVKVQSKTH